MPRDFSSAYGAFMTTIIFYLPPILINRHTTEVRYGSRMAFPGLLAGGGGAVLGAVGEEHAGDYDGHGNDLAGMEAGKPHHH